MTEKEIRDAIPESKLSFLWDDKVTGLGCALYPSGKKAFVLYYRADGKQHRVTLGRPGEMTLQDARKRAGAELTRIRNGEAGPAERRQEAREAPTLADALTRFFSETVPARLAANRMTQRTVDEYRRQAKRYVEPALGSLKVAKVTRADIERFAGTLADRSATHNRVLAFLSRIFALTEVWEWRPQNSNPVQKVVRAKEQARTRVLSPSEMTALNAALDELEWEYSYAVPAIRVALLTGLRIDRECLQLRWENINLESRVAVLGTKTGPRQLPLTDPVIQILSGLPQVEGNPWVFRGAVPGTRVQYKTARLVLAKACEMAGIADLRLHDLRRSYATSGAALGFNAFQVRDLLGHKTVTMAARYVQQAGLPEAAEALAKVQAEAMNGNC